MEWKRVPNYSRYEASTSGHIKTFNWKGSGRERIMKPALDSKGYLRTVLIRDDGAYHTIKVHRIIAQTFIKNQHNKPQINHKDGNKLNNNVTNLEWVTNKENAHHAIENGLFAFPKIKYGSKSNFSKLTESEVLEIRAKHNTGRALMKILANEYQVGPRAIGDIVNRKTWKHI